MGTSSVVKANQSVNERFIFNHDGKELHFPYATNIPIDEYNESITRILIAIHSSSYNPMDYLTAGKISAAMVHESESTLVIAPFFMREQHLPSEFEENLLFWGVSPFWGSHQGRKGSTDNYVRISGYEVLDTFLEALADKSVFPNLNTIVVAGHSAGGQLVNRYAASNRFDVTDVKPAGIHMRYIVMAPSSYLYFDGARAIAGSQTEFAIPSPAPQGYNDYGYGLNNLYSYLNETGQQTIRQQYANRFVFYLVGSEDDNTNDPSLDVANSALLQGHERLSRSLIYYNYLGYYYGNDIYNHHHRSVVSGMGHWGAGLMQSPQGLLYLYGDIPNEVSFAGGNGTTYNPYQISNRKQLNAVNGNLSSHYRLLNDIDMEGITYKGAVIAYNNGTSEGFIGTPFTGTFDGCGYAIKNLTISGSNNFIGMWGQIGTNGKIKNLRIIDCNISGNSRGGGLVGHNLGTITSSCITGNVVGNYCTGGLIGLNGGTISNCYATGTVLGTGNYCGGLCGYNYGTIISSHTTSVISGNSYVSGLCGGNGGAITSSFWDMDTSGQAASAGGTGKTTAQMKTISTFTDAGWDFVNEDVNGRMDLWYMPQDDYPYLYWQAAKGDIDYDESVDIMDLMIVAQWWLLSDDALDEGVRLRGDINLDGRVDMLDFVELMKAMAIID